MKDDYRIHLNFLAVIGRLPPFRVYRRPRRESEPRPDPASRSYSLPKADETAGRSLFWVRDTPGEGFTESFTHPEANNDLTRWVLFQAMRDTVKQHLRDEEYIIPEKSFLDEISLVMRSHPEGQELLRIGAKTTQAA